MNVEKTFTGGPRTPPERFLNTHIWYEIQWNPSSLQTFFVSSFLKNIISYTSFCSGCFLS